MTQRRFGGDELLAVAVGGAIGALARYAISVAVPHDDLGAWPWATFVTNLLGCLALGVLLDWVDARQPDWAGAHPRRARLARPLLASGVLGGFTTFSTYAGDAARLLEGGPHAALVGLAYIGGTLLGALSAVWAGAAGTRALLSGGQGRVRRREAR